MKTKMKILLIALFLIGFNVNAQVSETVSTTAKIITPILLDKERDLDFGTIASGTAVSVVDISTSGVRTKTGNATLVGFGSNHHAAELTTSGQGSYTFSITIIPSSLNLTTSGGGGGNSMLVDNFVSDPSLVGTLSSGGSKIISVGGKLHVGANQNTGTYTNTDGLTITVNYN